MKIGKFILSNEDKLNRAINGQVGPEGQAKGGVGKEEDKEGNVTNGAAIIAEYDRLGGLIQAEMGVDKKSGEKKLYKVKTGSFYDFKKQIAFKKPEVVYIFRDLAGDEIEVADGEEIPLEVQAAEVQKDKREKKAKNAKRDEDDTETIEEA